MTTFTAGMKFKVVNLEQLEIAAEESLYGNYCFSVVSGGFPTSFDRIVSIEITGESEVETVTTETYERPNVNWGHAFANAFGCGGQKRWNPNHNTFKTVLWGWRRLAKLLTCPFWAKVRNTTTRSVTEQTFVVQYADGTEELGSADLNSMHLDTWASFRPYPKFFRNGRFVSGKEAAE